MAAVAYVLFGAAPVMATVFLVDGAGDGGAANSTRRPCQSPRYHPALLRTAPV